MLRRKWLALVAVALLALPAFPALGRNVIASRRAPNRKPAAKVHPAAAVQKHKHSASHKVARPAKAKAATAQKGRLLAKHRSAKGSVVARSSPAGKGVIRSTRTAGRLALRHPAMHKSPLVSAKSKTPAAKTRSVRSTAGY
jgi:hypothetical protein